MAEKNGGNDQPDELRRLRSRMTVLEQRVAHNEEGTLRSRAVAGGLAAGAMALLLSLSLPWVRGGGFGPRSYESGDMRFDSARSVGTGWELLSAAYDDGRWMFVIGLVAVLLTALLAFVALFVERRGFHVAVQIAGWALPVVLVFVWPHQSSGGPEVGGGPWVVAAASLAVALAGFWATSEIDRTNQNRLVWEVLGRSV